jgi:hypothetical protein
MRFVTFRSHYSLIARSVGRPIVGRARKADATAPDAAPADNTNQLFAPTFRQFVESNRRVLLVFAETDRLYYEWEDKFVARHQEWVERHRSAYAVHVTPQANHIFSFAEWQADMLDASRQWLGREYPAAGSQAEAQADSAGAVAR